MVEDRTRHDRLRSLLPGTYATDPRDSAIGVLLEVLADRLREADQAIERGLRDKWLVTAEATRPSLPPADGDGPTSAIPSLPVVDLSDRPRPLEYLGAALDLLRQPWEVDTEAYRRRVEILAPLLAGGLGTPRAIIAMALSALGSEPCPVLEREGGETRGYGLPSGSLDRCRACRGGQIPAPGTPCPLRDRSTMNARVVDNPRRRVPLVRERLRPGASGSARIHLSNQSLFADRPELTLRVPPGATEAAIVPRLRSLTTGEELVVARVLVAGDTLSVRGPSPHDPSVPPQRQRWVDRPAAFAAAPAQVRVGADLDVPVILSSGSRFDGAVFGPEAGASSTAAAFARTLLVQTDALEVPALEPGANTWVYEPLTRDELQQIVADLPESPPPGVLPDPLDVPQSPDQTEVSLVLHWWVRAPSRFRLRIPLDPAVQAALAAGATDYLRRLIDRARPIGVLPIIDFLQPVEPEPLEPLDRLGAVELAMTEPLEPLAWLAPQDLDLPEPLAPEDGGGFIGVFDVTVFDFSLFSEIVPEPGIFDLTYYDGALFNPLEVEPGYFDSTYYEFALFGDLVLEPGELDSSYFDFALFQ